MGNTADLLETTVAIVKPARAAYEGLMRSGFDTAEDRAAWRWLEATARTILFDLGRRVPGGHDLADDRRMVAADPPHPVNLVLQRSVRELSAVRGSTPRRSPRPVARAAPASPARPNQAELMERAASTIKSLRDEVATLTEQTVPPELLARADNALSWAEGEMRAGRRAEREMKTLDRRMTSAFRASARLYHRELALAGDDEDAQLAALQRRVDRDISLSAVFYQAEDRLEERDTP